MILWHAPPRSRIARTFNARASWSNSKAAIGHGYTLVRQAVERIIREMDVEDKRGEVVRREAAPEPAEAPARQRGFSIREILPPHDPGSWPQGFTVSRKQIYDDMGRLTGGSEDSSGDGGPVLGGPGVEP